MKKDAVVYLNTKRKGDFEVQKSEVENYCKYRFNIINIYHDHRMSGVPPEKRESFREMMEYCDAYGMQHIILHNLCELAKNPEHSLAALKSLIDDDYVVHCATKDIFGAVDDPEQRQELIANFLDFMSQYRDAAGKPTPSGAKKTVKKGRKTIGRPKALNEGQIEALLTVRRTGTSISQICRMFDVSRSTVSKILSEYPELKGEWKGTRTETPSENE
ncbi:resolvase [Methanoculleus sp. FWC-SCC1]|uniref:Resolvase n=1 Tax=Methanoculleus frigidifontis TaxID=2584085 RepID=A0ABT8MDA2_9EURY|nr:recombinase family protein [Methanoculleus sp. FWC-SCC1]MDN7025915.1 resolvase [Methanoculleus sp. FWC-SCC1]